METLALLGGQPVRRQLIPIFRLRIEAGAAREIASIIEGGTIARGPRREELESRIRGYVGADCAIAMSSGTAALHVALSAMDLPRGGEVILPSLSFVATALAVEHAGLVPVFAEIDPVTLDLAPEDVERRIGPATCAIVPVHFAGHAADLGAIYDLARRRGLAVVEDAAHALGAAHEGRRIGASPAGGLDRHAVAFSMFATKAVTTGEGGLITTSSQEIARRAERLRGHGIVPLDGAPRTSGHYDVIEPGYNFHLSEIGAALGIHHLETLDQRTRARRRAGARLTELIAPIPHVRPQLARRDHVFHLYPVCLDTERLSASRDTIVKALFAEGVQAGVYYPPIHLFSHFQRRHATKRGDLPVTERACSGLITLPMHPHLTGDEIEDIAASLEKVIAHYQCR